MDKHHGKMVELELSFFEMTAALAFDYFAQSDVEVAVIETGLGGRLDATNILLPLVLSQTPVKEMESRLLPIAQMLGIDMLLGKYPYEVSGGEKQRISIARAMLKNAPIVILDEATSYTDPENEAVIQEAISRLTKGKTLIVIAHRLSTITDADQIVVVKDGTIQAKGTHEELLKECSLYHTMWTAHIGAKEVKTV